MTPTTKKHIGIDPIVWVRWIPEIARFPNKDERADAMRRAHTANLLNLRTWLISGSYVACFWAITALGIVPKSYLWVVFPVGLAALAIALMFFTRATVRKSLRTQLVASGEKICVNCAYDLRATAERRCPECGSPALWSQISVGTYLSSERVEAPGTATKWKNSEGHQNDE